MHLFCDLVQAWKKYLDVIGNSMMHQIGHGDGFLACLAAGTYLPCHDLLYHVRMACYLPSVIILWCQ